MTDDERCNLILFCIEQGHVIKICTRTYIVLV